MTRREEDAPLHERVLAVEGLASEQVLQSAGASLPSLGENDRVVLMSFAYADLPIGRTFDCWWPVGHPEMVVEAEARVGAVTQQFGRPFDEIPHGWKTITVLTFVNGVPLIVDRLPVINGWSYRPSLLLASRETWLALVRPDE